MKIIGFQKTTGVILIIVTTGLIVWDIFVAWTPVKGDTISEVVLTTAHKNPSLPFAFGVLMGHLFWAQNVKED